MMNSYILYALALAGVYIVYHVFSSILASRYHARQAAKLGCQRAFQRPYHWPFGIDLARDIIAADKAQILPNWLVDQVYEIDVQKHATWEQNFLGVPNLATSDPKNIQAMLATQFNDFSLGETRRKNFFPLLGNGIFTSDGKSWEHSRALLRPQFARDQVSDLELEETHVQDMMKHLPVDSTGYTPTVDLSPLFFRLTLDSATEFLFGESVHSQIAALPSTDKSLTAHNPGPLGTLDWTTFAPSFDAATMHLGQRGRLSDMYWLHSPRIFYQQCKLVHEFADYYVNLALNPHAEKSASSTTPSGRQKYVFLTELAKSTRDPIELRSQLLNILLAGRDTTAGLLGWTFYVLARDPPAYAKLRRIILDAFGTYDHPRDVTFANLKACGHLQHVLSEILRLYAIVPINSRRAVRDTTLPRGGGPDGLSPVYVRKGQEVNYSVHIMHRREDIWGKDASDFRPERWEGRKAGWEFLPFNGGPRICLGQQFALTEAGYVIVRMMQRFSAVEAADPEVLVKHMYSLTTSPLKCLVKLREGKD